MTSATCNTAFLLLVVVWGPTCPVFAVRDTADVVIYGGTAGGRLVRSQSGRQPQAVQTLEKGRVTVPHPKRDIPIGTLKSIERQAGIKLT